MHASDMLEYGNKIIEVFRNGTSLSEYLKESDNATYDYMLKDVNNFIQKSESIAEKINTSLQIMQKSLLMSWIEVKTKKM